MSQFQCSNKYSMSLMFVFFRRCSAPRRNCNFIPRRICGKLSLISVPSAVRPLPIAPICHSTLGFILVSNLIVARSVNASLPNSRICSSTFALIPVTNRTSKYSRTYLHTTNTTTTSSIPFINYSNLCFSFCHNKNQL